MNEIPPYLSPGEVGEACGISRKKAHSMLARAGILERLGERWVVWASQLRERLPEVYDRVYTHLVLGPESTLTGPK